MKKRNDVDGLLKARTEIDQELRRHKAALTIVFTDIVGSTAYFDRYGDTAGLAMLDRQIGLVTKTFTSHKGRIIKTIGDSVMAEFPDASQGVRASIAAQEGVFRINQELPERERILMRVGINSGVGFRRDNDVFGDAVNLAARITKQAGPAQILVSRSVRDETVSDTTLRCNWQGKAAMAGKSNKEDIYEVLWTDEATYAELRKGAEAGKPPDEALSPDGNMEALIPPADLGAPTADVIPAAPAGLPEVLTRRYEVLEQVGRGGMGVVYKARDRETGEVVALKLIKPEVADDATYVERFKRELRLARKITHKNVCRIHEFSREGAVAFISMEFVSGENLRAIINRFGGLPTRKALEIAEQIFSGLREAHAQGVIHRDLKPENIMLDETGQVKLMDFGLARCDEVSITQAGKIVGTPGYLAPEMIEGKPADQRADVYAVGCVLYEMFTGQRAFKGDLPVTVTLHQMQETPRPPRELEPGVPLSVDRAIMRCLERRPEQRFSSVDQLEAAIQDALPPPSLRSQSGRHVSAQQSALLAMARRPPQALSRGLRIALTAGLLVIAASGVAWQSWKAVENSESQAAPAPATSVAAAIAKQAETSSVAGETRGVTSPAEPPKTVRPARSAQLICEYQLKDGKLTISSGGKVLLNDSLTGARKGGFLGIKSGFAGVFSKPFTIPPAAQELSVQVVSLDKSVAHTGRVTAVPQDREATTLHVTVFKDRLAADWRKPSNAKP